MKVAKRSARAKRRQPVFKYKNGRKIAVILDIRTYREILEQIQDVEDLTYLKKLRKRPIKTRPLEEVAAELGL